ncbi:LURP-one-related/scramblase family protein [Lederbergia lenta]|uniref:Uncharacterized protein n=1 Tax=Lederbergia lenta TaxID=1467 RepID=A0A2X4VM53_LEDLE|nr:hypothetical protein [Lederbergia lenta]MCM3112299.1 hypothetical protein [Lederbergia lenta]MEC2326519.1 hypothetical protein [Lederbergia lenta]SQI53236.1 Uncharacterised protein [Lederbergia lenta]
MSETIYFTDNLFSSGITTIYSDEKVAIGNLDLKSAFTSNLAILDLEGNQICEGKFKTFSNKWVISKNGEEIGELKQKFTFLKKAFAYTSYKYGLVSIESEAFSKEYHLYQSDEVIADFQKVSGFFQSSSFQLINHSKRFTNAELITIVMGIHMITKRNATAANSGH